VEEIVRKADGLAVERGKKSAIFALGRFARQPGEGARKDLFRQDRLVEGEIGRPQAPPLAFIILVQGANDDTAHDQAPVPIFSRS
jgi:hypothetical protein